MNETRSFNEQRYSNYNLRTKYQPDFSLSRSSRIVEEAKLDPITKQFGRIVYCNGVNACGNEMFLAATCEKSSCDNTFCTFIWRGNVVSPGQLPSNEPGQRAPFVSWIHVIRLGYWCMPCCILEENVHPKMAVCSSLSTREKFCEQQNRHGRCGIEFDP